jgi:XTP/dITP diphosphohydrolase
LKSLIFATANAYKLAELRAILPQFTIKGLTDIGIHEDIPETGLTLEENAYIKAKYLYDRTGAPSFSEDTGLEVMALEGQPGVHTARYAGDQRNPNDNMAKLLQALSKKEDRTAQFRTVIAMVEDGNVKYFEGIVKGRIALEKSGNEGFGYDPIFIPDGYDHTFADLSNDIKNQISHRARAVQKLVEFLIDF